MPKKPNPKKLAAKELQKGRVLFAAEAGEFVVARVVKSLGFCQFQLETTLPSGKIELKGLIRGLNKGGGANSSTRVRPDCYVMLSCSADQIKRSPKTIWEIAGVANRREEIQRLKEAGRVSRDLDLDDLFDRFGEEDAEDAPDANEDIWADANPKRKKAAQQAAEAASQAAELLARYRKAAAGARTAGVADCLHAGRHEELPEAAEADAEAADEVFAWDAPAAAGGSGGRREITSRRRLAALAAAEAAAHAAENAAAAAEAARIAAEMEAEAELEAELERRRVPANWEEDELDIDAI